MPNLVNKIKLTSTSWCLKAGSSFFYKWNITETDTHTNTIFEYKSNKIKTIKQNQNQKNDVCEEFKGTVMYKKKYIGMLSFQDFSRTKTSGDERDSDSRLIN